MGGRKGYSLKKVVGDLRKVKKEQQELIEGITKEDPKQIIKNTAKILSKSKGLLESIAYGVSFVQEEGKELKRLKEKEAKERRRELAKKWTKFRKKEKKKFDQTRNRFVVDSINEVLGGKKK